MSLFAKSRFGAEDPPLFQDRFDVRLGHAARLLLTVSGLIAVRLKKDHSSENLGGLSTRRETRDMNNFVSHESKTLTACPVAFQQLRLTYSETFCYSKQLIFR
jgi:hypothetical protein